MVLGLDIDFIDNEKKEITKLMSNIESYQSNQHSLITVVGKGKNSPKFISYLNSAGGTTSLDDLKGKYVYIDVWATWCVPCLVEIPFLKNLEKTYQNKNIEFVSISVDEPNDYDKWKTMVIEKELGGIQLFADKAFKSEFIVNYFINSIPRFILIDPKGYIINPDAPKPSNNK